MKSATDLIERISSAPSSADIGVFSNDLLKQFYRERPVDDLKVLLKNQDERVVAIAVWIASEVGERCVSLWGEIVPLLNHPLQQIRFWALDCLIWAPIDNSFALAKGVALLGDPEAGIRRKVMDLLSRLPESRLRTISSDNASLLGTALSSGLKWLLSPAGKQLAAIADALQSQDQVMRKFAVIAAARLGSRGSDLLVNANSASDDDVAVFAQRRI